MGTCAILPIFLYAALYCKARKLRNRVLVALADRKQEAHKREWKATITFFLLFVTAFALTILPSLIAIADI